MKTYPIFLTHMEQRPAVVVGGGRVAARKVKDLLRAGAPVTVISPQICSEITALASAHPITMHQRPFEDGDLQGAFLAIAATDDPQANQTVYRSARTHGCLVNMADSPQQCDFFVPATLVSGDLSIAISSGGSSPALARWLRQRVEAIIEPELGELSALLEEMRPQIIQYVPDSGRLHLIERLIDANILLTIRENGLEAAKAQISHILEYTPPEEWQGSHE